MRKVLFVCVHNAGRSQMAEAFFNHYATDALGLSAGTHAGSRINPQAADAMREIGISMEGQSPKQMTPEMIAESDRIITMGCGVDAESCPAGFLVTEDWGLDDPAGQPIEVVRKIRDEIKKRVLALIQELNNA